MPHLIVEFSSNIAEKQQFSSLFAKCHPLLVQGLPTQLSHCKSRAIEYDHYWIGNGDTKNGFIHANLKILPGRTPETLNQVAETLMAVFKAHFAESMRILDLQITLEVSELDSHYKVYSEIN